MPSTARLLSAAAIVTFLSSGSAHAQPAPQREASPPAESRAAAAPVTQVIVANDRDAGETRGDFESVLRRLPPAVGQVMRIDPSLMRNPGYLAAYPTLASFLQGHPEVVQNPGFYLEHVQRESWTPPAPDDPRTEAIRMWRDLMQGILVAGCLITAALGLLWLIRTLVEYRRWYRTSRVQTEVHTKLLDRFTSNEDLMAYMQTPSGRRFLESAPLPMEGPARPMGAPLSRILWSLQAGIVLATGGLGTLFVSRRVLEEVAQPLFAVGVLVLALGSGFIVSAAASFILSRRLGLLDPRASTLQPGDTARATGV